jgi:hypothetical protein
MSSHLSAKSPSNISCKPSKDVPKVLGTRITFKKEKLCEAKCITVLRSPYKISEPKDNLFLANKIPGQREREREK